MIATYSQHVSKINKKVAQAADLLDSFYHAKQLAIQTLIDKNVQEREPYYTVMMEENVKFDKAVKEAGLDICLFAVVYDAYVRAALGDSYTAPDLATFLNARNQLTRTACNAYYTPSAVEDQIIIALNMYYTPRA